MRTTTKPADPTVNIHNDPFLDDDDSPPRATGVVTSDYIVALARDLFVTHSPPTDYVNARAAAKRSLQVAQGFGDEVLAFLTANLHAKSGAPFPPSDAPHPLDGSRHLDPLSQGHAVSARQAQGARHPPRPSPLGPSHGDDVENQTARGTVQPLRAGVSGRIGDRD